MRQGPFDERFEQKGKVRSTSRNRSDRRDLLNSTATVAVGKGLVGFSVVGSLLRNAEQ